MSTSCPSSDRLWNALLADGKTYKALLDEQLTAIKERSFEFSQFDKDLKGARRAFGFAKAAVINHHRLHGCSEHP